MASKNVLNTQSHALLSLYVTLYSAKYGRAPEGFNRFRDKWGFQSMIEDLGYDQARLVVNYYMESHRPSHPVDQLLYRYDQINRVMIEREKDDALRAKVRQETKLRLEEWEKNGNEGSGSSISSL